jgi:hypothetical protein
MQQRETDTESDFFGEMMKIALGIFVGGLLLWAAIEYRARYELHQAAKAVETELAAQTERARQREADRARRREFTRQQEIATVERRAVAEREAYERERLKERAWKVFFQPSPKCLNEWSIECGNEHIRARREFERNYAQ